MKSTYDTIADALYITFRKGKVVNTVKLADRVIVDLDKSGNMIGMEILDAKNQLAVPNFSLLSSIPIQTLRQATM